MGFIKDIGNILGFILSKIVLFIKYCFSYLKRLFKAHREFARVNTRNKEIEHKLNVAFIHSKE